MGVPRKMSTSKLAEGWPGGMASVGGGDDASPAVEVRVAPILQMRNVKAQAHWSRL